MPVELMHKIVKELPFANRVVGHCDQLQNPPLCNERANSAIGSQILLSGGFFFQFVHPLSVCSRDGPELDLSVYHVEGCALGVLPRRSQRSSLMTGSDVPLVILCVACASSKV